MIAGSERTLPSIMLPSDPAMQDPKPEPPCAADYDACCGSGCDPCIFDLYDRAVERYRQALAAWLERHPEAAPAEEAEVRSQPQARSASSSENSG